METLAAGNIDPFALFSEEQTPEVTIGGHVEVFWGRGRGGWMRGKVIAQATEDDELIQMPGQSGVSKLENAVLIEFEVRASSQPPPPPPRPPAAAADANPNYNHNHNFRRRQRPRQRQPTPTTATPTAATRMAMRLRSIFGRNGSRNKRPRVTGASSKAT